MKRGHNIKLLSEVVVYLLYIEAISEGSSLEKLFILERLPGGSTNHRLLEYAIDDLQGKRFMQISVDHMHNQIFALNRNGYEYAQTRLSMPGSAMHECSIDLNWILGEEALGDDTFVDEEVTQSPENKNDDWEPLPLERESDVYQEALVASEEAEKTIREDNGFAANYPEIRDSIVWAVGSAINQMREGLITVGQVRTMLIAPFQKVASLFSEGLLKEASERAIEKLIGLF